MEIIGEGGATDVVDGDDDIGVDAVVGGRERGGGGDAADAGEGDGAAAVEREVDLAIELELGDVQIDVEEAELHLGGFVIVAVAGGVDVGGGGEVGALDEEVVVAVDDVDFDVGRVALAVKIAFGEIDIDAVGEVGGEAGFEGNGVGEGGEIGAGAGGSNGKLIGVAAEIEEQIVVVGFGDAEADIVGEGEGVAGDGSDGEAAHVNFEFGAGAEESEVAGLVDGDGAEKSARDGAVDLADDIVIDHVGNRGAADVAEQVGEVHGFGSAGTAEEGKVIFEDARDIGVEVAIAA